MSRHEVIPENALRFLEWINDRGGVAVWKSIDLSDPGYSVSTPALTDGEPTRKPHWKVGETPDRVITDAADIDVIKYKEVKRFHVGLRRGAQGLSIKLTDAASARVRREVEKAGEGASYEFDYETQDAVILAPDGVTPLNQWSV